MEDIKISFAGVIGEHVRLNHWLDGEYSQHGMHELLGNRAAFAKIFQNGPNSNRMRAQTQSAYTVDHMIVDDWSRFVNDHATAQVQLLYYTNTYGGTVVTVFDDTSAESTLVDSRYYLKEFTADSGMLWQFSVNEYPLVTNLTYYLPTIHIDQWLTPHSSVSSLNYSRLDRVDSAFESSDGSLSGGRISDQRYRFNFTWRGVSDAIIERLEGKLQHDYNSWCYLYAEADTSLLVGATLRRCRIVNYNYTKLYNDWNILSMTFDEVTE